jgi:AraC family cel operon transcriptional repressor
MVAFAGRFENFVRDRWLEMQPGQGVFIADRDLHQVQGRDCDWVNIAFTPEWLARADDALAAKGRIRSLPRCARPPRIQLTAQEADLMLHRIRGLSPHQQGQEDNSLFRLLLLETLAGFLAARRPSAGSPLRPAWLGKLLEDFHRLPLEQISRDRLVEMSGRSQEHLCRVLRSRLRQSPTELVNAARLDQATRLLKTSQRSVTDIALDCGYQSLSYFYRRFRKRFGCSPRQYRLRHWQPL